MLHDADGESGDTSTYAEIRNDYTCETTNVKKRPRDELSKDESDGIVVEGGTTDLDLPLEFEDGFAIAIFELGLRNASPKYLLGMFPPDIGLTSDTIKSHLQKYRQRFVKSKEEFITFYHDYLSASFHEVDRNRSLEIKGNKGDVKIKSKIPRTIVSEENVVVKCAESKLAEWYVHFERILVEHVRILYLTQNSIESEKEDLPDDLNQPATELSGGFEISIANSNSTKNQIKKVSINDFLTVLQDQNVESSYFEVGLENTYFEMCAALTFRKD